MNMKMIYRNASVYEVPEVDIIEIGTEGILCVSSEELDDLQKNSFDFDWQN